MISLFVLKRDTPPLATEFEDLGAVSVHWANDPGRLLIYAHDASAEKAVAARWPDASRHELHPLSSINGAGKDEFAPAHYIVWTDAADGWWDELNAWYADEHLPGLASVPGAIRARRFEQSGDGPRHFACYDLAVPEVLGSPPWLKVRTTAWSSRVRPNFRNTRRWMCRTLLHHGGDAP